MNPLLTLAELKQKHLVEERLKAIAAQLIAAHRCQNHALLVPYARQAGLAVEAQAPHHLFMKAIQVFHPDRLTVVWGRVERAVQTSDQVSLNELTRLLEYHPDRTARPRPEADFEDEEEEYGFDPGDFGFDPNTDFEDEFAEDKDWDEDAGTFYSAVKCELFGNLELYPDAADLAKLEGELDLSDYDLHDLEGIEFCQGLMAINLSRNNIDNIFPLSALTKLEVLDLAENDLEDADALGGLSNLKELDLSANEIDDIAFLDRLPRLQYVDLTGNPVRNKAVIERLEDRGVIVIF
jgi:hypothetical protein